MPITGFTRWPAEKVKIFGPKRAPNGSTARGGAKKLQGCSRDGRSRRRHGPPPSVLLEQSMSSAEIGAEAHTGGAKDMGFMSKPIAKMTRQEAKAEHDLLVEEIKKHDRLYYIEDRPAISDAEYDQLRLRSDALEKRFPDLVTAESPSRRVGAPPSEKFAKVRHSIRMLSLGNVFKEEEVHEFVARVRRFLKLDPRTQLDFTAEMKIDGLSVSLRYERGELIAGATRGDG